MDLICCNCLLSLFSFFFDFFFTPTRSLLVCPLLLFSHLRPVDSLVVSWKRDGRRVAGGRRLVVPAPTSSDTGLYVCEASQSNSTAKPAEAKAHLTVMGEKKGNHTHTHTHTHTNTHTHTHTHCLTSLSMIIPGRPDPSKLMPPTCAINFCFNLGLFFSCTFFASGTDSFCLFLHLFLFLSWKRDCERPRL